ncbi:MAG: hypothetical protein QXE84_01050 [Candidatus Nitrosotenuis sp.]|nr:hypothetical protein [Candidatus Nitrosotenuis uzonensis]
MHTHNMTYCIECGDDAEVCYCGKEGQPATDYVDSPTEEILSLKCYCEKHKPK